MGAQRRESFSVNARTRVVLDTNTVVSALLFANGRLAPLRNAWQVKAFLPVISSATAGELIRVLAYPKFKLTVPEQEELLADFLPYCETWQVPEVLKGVPPCRDADDVMFLHLAIAAKARYLVSGDKDLLVVATKAPLSIVTPDAFLKILGSS